MNRNHHSRDNDTRFLEETRQFETVKSLLVGGEVQKLQQRIADLERQFDQRLVDISETVQKAVIKQNQAIIRDIHCLSVNIEEESKARMKSLDALKEIIEGFTEKIERKNGTFTKVLSDKFEKLEKQLADEISEAELRWNSAVLELNRKTMDRNEFSEILSLLSKEVRGSEFQKKNDGGRKKPTGAAENGHGKKHLQFHSAAEYGGEHQVKRFITLKK